MFLRLFNVFANVFEELLVILPLKCVVYWCSQPSSKGLRLSTALRHILNEMLLRKILFKKSNFKKSPSMGNRPTSSPLLDFLVITHSVKL